MTDYGFGIDDDYIREVSSYYWEEEEEMRLGIHPSQILERVQNTLKKLGVKGEITFMDYSPIGAKVNVFVDNKLYDVFDYSVNLFENQKQKTIGTIVR